MDIYLTNLKTKDRLRIPMLPEEITVKKANQFASYSIITIGDVRIPSGTSLDSFSWSATLPGKKRKKEPYVREWHKPNEIYKWITNLKAKNGKPVKARLLITETPINCDVYLQDFSPKPTGGYGDIEYSITFVQAKEIKIKKKGEAENKKSSTNKKGSAKKSSKKGSAKKKLKDKPSSAPERTSKAKEQTYKVKSGDCLWKIAQRLYGSGSQYTKIYNANKKTIGSNPDKIYPGQVLTIP